MSSRGYTVLGWAVWQLAKYRLKHKGKLGAALAVLAVLAAGVLASKAATADDD
jgi:hypothetical protein